MNTRGRLNYSASYWIFFIFTGNLYSHRHFLMQESNFKRDVKEEMIIHERMLRRVNTNDYGRYDQSPSLPRPRHKLIPN